MLKQIILLVVLLLFSSCKVGRFIYYNYGNITDYKIFPSRTINNGKQHFEFYRNVENIDIDIKVKPKANKKSESDIITQKLDEYLKQNRTVAFLIIRNDTIIYENYFKGYNESSIVASFSMAKSFLSALIGCAIDDGYIKSVNQPITDFIPDLKKNGLDKVTISHLLDMRSGIKFNESYVNPFGHIATSYYGRNLRKQIMRMQLEIEPGTKTRYRSIDTQILGLVLEKALKNKTVSAYLEEKIWLPLGMEYPATWSLDKKKNGLEKTYCCLNARARDYAKFGRLYLNKGNWNGQQIISESWVIESTKKDENFVSELNYNNKWWLHDNDVFAAEGYRGQYISVHPKSNMIFVRLGEKIGKTSHWKKLFAQLEKRLGVNK